MQRILLKASSIFGAPIMHNDTNTVAQ